MINAITVLRSMRYICALALLFINTSAKIEAADLDISAAVANTSSSPYVYNPYVDMELWDILTPYFLPEHFPEKAALDRIFSKRRVLSSVESMRKAGFLIISPTDKIIVARHYKLPGFLIKVYLDPLSIGEWIWWKKRIDGARLIQAGINQHGYQGFMKTPRKWIYPLPADPGPKEGHNRRNFILVVEDVEPLSPHKNHLAYKNKMTPDILNALYNLLTENLLIDSVYADNTPFCKDGKIAFLDTEHAQDLTQPLPLSAVGNFLSTEMRDYWIQMIQTGGPH